MIGRSASRDFDAPGLRGRWNLWRGRRKIDRRKRGEMSAHERYEADKASPLV
jgi:hypothetical protein